jgi:uncharacterized protein YkwD
MNFLLLLLLIPAWIPGFTPPGTTTNPLESFDTVWKDTKYAACNTARNVKYLSATEKEVIYVLNLARLYPQQFNKTVVAKWPTYIEESWLVTNTYYTSLVTLLDKMQPVGMLSADSVAWISARCHAISSGQKGYVGHDRQSETCTQQQKYWAECCHYGYNSAVEIVLSLLVDKDVPSLGHRITLLSDSYKAVGVSLKPHTTYRFNTVLDFTY